MGGTGSILSSRAGCAADLASSIAAASAARRRLRERATNNSNRTMIAATPASNGADVASSDTPDAVAGTLAASTAVGTDAAAGALASAVDSEAAGEDCWIAPLAAVMSLAAVPADAPAALEATLPGTGACVAPALPDGLVEAEAVDDAFSVCAAGAGMTAWPGVELAPAAETGPEASAGTAAEAEAGADASGAEAAPLTPPLAPFPRSTAGTVNTAPSLNRFRSCPMNAPGFASNSALDIFSLIARSCDPVNSPAMSLSDCPGFTAYCVAPAADAATAAEAEAEAEAAAASAALACAWTSKGSDPNSTPVTLAAISAARRARLDGRCLGTGRLARTIIEAPGEWTSYVGKRSSGRSNVDQAEP
jgi:hypothetical protein